MRLLAHRFETPIGPLLAAVDGEGRLVRIDFRAAGPLDALAAAIRASGDDVAWDRAACADVVAEMDAYFRGELREFTLPLRPRGTGFERRVWDALLRIPYGRTRTYGSLAAELGRPDAARAVGRANAANPIPIVIPCHRVIGANGKLAGYGGGLDVKDYLLALEGAVLLPVGPAPLRRRSPARSLAPEWERGGVGDAAG